MGYESDLIRRITGGIGAISRGEKTPKQAGLGKFFAVLKPINVGQHDELMEKYKQIIEKLKQ
jgi:hypothetical protein